MSILSGKGEIIWPHCFYKGIQIEEEQIKIVFDYS